MSSRYFWRTSASAIVLAGLCTFPQAAVAQQAPSASSSTLAEVVVTASRRSQTLESVPYNISSVGGAELRRDGVADLASLSYQVPGLSTYDLGARMAGATSPIIRGINADGAPLGNRMAEQSPVGVYINNSPSDGYFQLDDVSRIEVLRGPQGTLYGAGSLGGALRIIPNSAQLGVYSGRLDASIGGLAHSGEPSYGFSGYVNIPVGDQLAFRVSERYSKDPGFINADGLLERSGSAVSGVPVLANPSQPVTSSGVFYGKKDWNWQEASTTRASLTWKPTNKLSVEFATIFARVDGDGGPQINTTFAGGAYPNDPRITLPAGGDYQAFSAIDQPFQRDSTLTSLDVSYDAGFATLSSTTSYSTTRGVSIIDDTYGQAVYTFSFPYYSGNPTNPRFVSPFEFADTENTVSQEVRLVSNTAPGKAFDYVLGAFYEHQRTGRIWDISAPGSPEYSAAEGCTAPYTRAFSDQSASYPAAAK